MAEKKKSEKKKLSKEEVKKKILALAKKGLTSEKIGLELKKQKIYVKDYNLKIGRFLKENKLWKDPDIFNLQEKVKRLKKHVQENKQDTNVKPSQLKKEAKFLKLKKYRQA